MLKRKEAASQPEDFVGATTFRPFVGDARFEDGQGDPAQVETLIVCSGRVTWDLMVERGKRENGHSFAIGRVERLYPNPIEEIRAEIAKYPNLKAIRWVQDEPRNMGPWPHYALNVWPELGVTVEPITRPASASPSVGTVKRHVEEQKTLLDAAFEAPGPRGTDY
jgi:2-oxoglutarate dehydrogenase E1 component